MGAKLHTGIPTPFLKDPERKYFQQSSSKSFSPIFLLVNKEVKKQPTPPINTAGGSTKHSSKFFYLLTKLPPDSTLSFLLPFTSKRKYENTAPENKQTLE